MVFQTAITARFNGLGESCGLERTQKATAFMRKPLTLQE